MMPALTYEELQTYSRWQTAEILALREIVTKQPQDQKERQMMVGDKPAFPYPGESLNGFVGMSMREWYAGRAPMMPYAMLREMVKGIIEEEDSLHSCEDRLVGELASWAFRFADAMLEAAKK